MITILCSSELTLWNHCYNLHLSSEGSILLAAQDTDENRSLGRHNANLRDLLAKLRLLLGNEAFEEAVLRHKVAASFLLDRLVGELSLEEQREARKLSTSLDSQTSHNWFTSSFLAEKWANLLAELVAGRKVLWIIPDVDDMGPSFIEVVRRLLINHRPECLELVLGFKTEQRPYVPDENGILWYYRQIRNLKDSFSMFEDSAIYELPHSSTGIVLSGKPFEVDLWDLDRDGDLLRALANDTCSEAVLEQGCSLLIRAFEAYDFRAALKIGLMLLRHEADLSSGQIALVHAATGIAAHNRQFSASRGDDNFNEFLCNHFTRALELEEDVMRRSAISYRLATTLARRHKNADDAIACVNRSLGELHSAIPPSRRRAYYEAWLLNIRAYGHMLRRNYTQSAADVESAFEMAEKFWNHSDDPSPDEIYSAQLFAGNRATLAMYGHDNDALETWFSKGTGLFEKHWEVGTRYVRYLRVELSKRKLDLKAAVVAAREGLSDSIKQRSAEYQDLYRINLADLYYRLGMLDEVFGLLRDSFRMYSKLKEERRHFMAQMFLAEVEARTGNLKAADGLYCLALESQGESSLATRADLLSARALLAARAGRGEDAENLIDEAITTAVESGEQGILVLVSQRTGEALLQFGEVNQAQEAFLKGLEIADASPPGGSSEAQLGDITRILLGLYDCCHQPEYLERVLRILPEVLVLDSNTWWELPRILGYLLDERNAALIEMNHPEMELLLRAAEQRCDTRAVVAKFLVMEPSYQRVSFIRAS